MTSCEPCPISLTVIGSQIDIEPEVFDCMKQSNANTIKQVQITDTESLMNKVITTTPDNKCPTASNYN